MRFLLLCTTAAIALGSSVGAFAQDGSAGNEIVVTAQRRSEVIEQVPMAVSVVTGDALERALVLLFYGAFGDYKPLVDPRKHGVRVGYKF